MKIPSKEEFERAFRFVRFVGGTNPRRNLNPERIHQRLLELLSSPETRPEMLKLIEESELAQALEKGIQ